MPVPIIIAIVLQLLLLVDQTRAESILHESPAVCSGFHYAAGQDADDQEVWGQPESGVCPRGYAVYGARPWTEAHYSSPEYVAMRVSCCKLPSASILIDEHIWVEHRCPANFVATGAQYPCYPNKPRDCQPEKKLRKMRCTKINTELYQLGEVTQGAYWGVGAIQWHQKLRVMKANIPAAIRYSMGRKSKFRWMLSGCAGYPFGSLLVGKGSKRCHDLEFRSLQYRIKGAILDAGDPVQMYPECRSISSPFEKEPECLN